MTQINDACKNVYMIVF